MEFSEKFTRDNKFFDASSVIHVYSHNDKYYAEVYLPDSILHLCEGDILTKDENDKYMVKKDGYN